MPTLKVSSVTCGSVEQDLERLFRENYPMLYRTAYSLLDNQADAEDVPQTIFLRLLRNGMTPDMQRNPSGYLYRAAVNLSLNIIRERRRREVPAENIADREDTSESNTKEDNHRLLSKAIAELDQDAAQILILRYVHNQSDADIAKVMGTSRGTIAMRLFRARARLKKLMRDLSGGTR